MRQLLACFVVGMIATFTQACDVDPERIAPFVFEDAPTCNYTGGWGGGGPVIDLGNGRIVQPTTTNFVTASCGTAFDLLAYDCATKDAFLIRVHEENAPRFAAISSLNFKRWTARRFTPALKQSDHFQVLKEFAKFSTSEFNNGIKNSFRNVLYLPGTQGTDLPSMNCACGHFYSN